MRIADQVLPNAYVTRVLWADEKDAERNLVASGVEYIFGEQKLTVTASKEVILSAGFVGFSFSTNHKSHRC